MPLGRALRALDKRRLPSPHYAAPRSRPASKNQESRAVALFGHNWREHQTEPSDGHAFARIRRPRSAHGHGGDSCGGSAPEAATTHRAGATRSPECDAGRKPTRAYRAGAPPACCTKYREAPGRFRTGITEWGEGGSARAPFSRLGLPGPCGTFPRTPTHAWSTT